ncbi:MAG: hypothetical protein EZS28_042018, partial [Streblomastix strix]
LYYQREDSGDGTENERQASKTSTRQCWRLPSGPVADVGRDLLMRCMKMRRFSEEKDNILFKGQMFNTVKRYFYSLEYLWYWLDKDKITTEEKMKRDAEVILTEVIAFHTRQNSSVASAKSYKACITTTLSFIYKENLESSTTSKLIDKALANATISYRRYQDIWNIQILFNRWRLNETAAIRLKFFNVNKAENQAFVRFAPNQANAIETYEVYETDNEKLSPKLAIYEWIERLKKQFPKGKDLLLWHKDFKKPTTTKDVSQQHTKLLRELRIIGASAYSIRHSVTTELAKLGITKRDLATFRLHSQNSCTVQQFYIITSQIRVNDIARQLTSNPGQDNESLNQVSQQRCEIGREGGYHLLSSSPSESGQLFDIPVSPYLTSSPPKTCIPTRIEIEIWRKFPREPKDRTSRMMLKVGLELVE